MRKEQLPSILFIDIETAPVVPDFESLSENMKKLWTTKSQWHRARDSENSDPARIFDEKAGIFSEFSKIICVSIGSLNLIGNEWIFRLKSFTDDAEKTLLNNFLSVISRYAEHQKRVQFCGHNIKEFDLPFICRRSIINGIPLPEPLQLQNRKPWDHPHIDTMELWRFGDVKHFTSLALLAEILGIPSPKQDMDGSMVGKVFWEEKNIARISEYCMQDVITSARVYLQLTNRNDCSFRVVYA